MSPTRNQGIRISLVFSLAKLDARKQWSNTFKVPQIPKQWKLIVLCVLCKILHKHLFICKFLSPILWSYWLSLWCYDKRPRITAFGNMRQAYFLPQNTVLQCRTHRTTLAFSTCDLHLYNLGGFCRSSNTPISQRGRSEKQKREGIIEDMGCWGGGIGHNKQMASSVSGEMLTASKYLREFSIQEKPVERP